MRIPSIEKRENRKNRKSSDCNQVNLGPGKNQRPLSPCPQKIKNSEELKKNLKGVKRGPNRFSVCLKPFRENPRSRFNHKVSLKPARDSYKKFKMFKSLHIPVVVALKPH